MIYIQVAFVVLILNKYIEWFKDFPTIILPEYSSLTEFPRTNTLFSPYQLYIVMQKTFQQQPLPLQASRWLAREASFWMKPVHKKNSSSKQQRHGCLMLLHDVPMKCWIWKAINWWNLTIKVEFNHLTERFKIWMRPTKISCLFSELPSGKLT